MASLNRATLIGSVIIEPELRCVTRGQTVMSFQLATSEQVKGREGVYEQRTECHNIVVPGKNAEVLFPLIQKGTRVFVEGRLYTRHWQGNDGNARYRTEITADSVQILARERPETTV